MLQIENGATFVFLGKSLKYAQDLIQCSLPYLQNQGYHMSTLYCDC